MHADNVGCVLPQLRHKPVVGAGEQLYHIVIERIHVLDQPLFTAVVHLGVREGRRGREGGGREGGREGGEREKGEGREGGGKDYKPQKNK